MSVRVRSSTMAGSDVSTCIIGQIRSWSFPTPEGGSVSVPYSTVRNVLTSLEATQLEPGLYDRKVYAPGIGIAMEPLTLELDFPP